MICKSGLGGLLPKPHLLGRLRNPFIIHSKRNVDGKKNVAFTANNYLHRYAKTSTSFPWKNLNIIPATLLCDILIYIHQDATLHSLFYLETSLHVSSGTITHHQERKQLYLQHLVFVTPLLLSAAIVEELELVWVYCGWRTPPTVHSNQLHFGGYKLEYYYDARTHER